MASGHVVRIDAEVWSVLQLMAEPLRDAPNDVLRRVLGLDPVLAMDNDAVYGLRSDVRDVLVGMVERSNKGE